LILDIKTGKRWLLKKIWILMAAIMLAFFLEFAASAELRTVDRIVAVVNDDIIRLRQLERELEPFKQSLELESENLSPEQMRERLYEARMQLLNELINETLADQQISQAGIKIDDAEVDAAIEQVKSRNYYTDEDLRQALGMQGLSMEDYRKELRRQILRSRLVNLKVKSGVVITPEDLRRYYEDNPEKYGGTKKYRIRNILISVPGSNDDFSATKKIIDEISRKAESGVSFPDLAKKYSHAPNAADGGALGVFAIDDLARDLRPVIEDLKQGEISGAVKTPQGVQVFYLEEIVDSPPKPFESVKEEIEEKLYNEQVDEKYRAWLQTLREEAHIRIIR
jgi:peptidyl-prolyl cis-trans isomerase SurA